MEWFESICDGTGKNYVIRTSNWKSGTQYVYLKCHREGDFKSRGNNVRKLKSQGSSRCVKKCSAEIVSPSCFVVNGQIVIKLVFYFYSDSYSDTW